MMYIYIYNAIYALIAFCTIIAFLWLKDGACVYRMAF